MFDFGALAEMKEAIDKKDPNKKNDTIEVFTSEKGPDKTPIKSKVATKTKKVVTPKVEKATISESEVVTLEEEVVTKPATQKVSMDDKLDAWIEEYKGQPKIVYSDTTVLCTYLEDTETVTILNRLNGESIDFVDKAFFEDAVFNSNTRPEKEKKILDKYKEITGIKFTSNDNWGEASDSEVTMIEESEEEIVIPDEEEIVSESDFVGEGDESFSLPDDILDI